jgi:hypothetical protein
VRRGHQHVLRRDARSLGRAAFRLVENIARDHAAIDNGERQSRIAVVKYQATGVDFIVNVLDFPVAHVPGDGEAERRRDVARRGARAEGGGLLGGG